MQRTLAITTLILLAGVGAALADGDIWRWKDAQGVFHYSDQWVPGSELIKSNSKSRPSDDASANRSTADATDADRTIQQQQTARTVAADGAIEEVRAGGLQQLGGRSGRLRADG